LFLASILSLCFVLGGCVMKPVTDNSEVKYITISKEAYYDKTLAGLIAQPAGVLTGYEFVWTNDGRPYLAMPDSWFDLVNGPYAGNFEHFDPNWSAYNRLLSVGAPVGDDAYTRIGGDDDYHIDIFNQLILKECGPFATAADIRDMWVKYTVRDFGGGMSALPLFQSSLLSTFCGKREYGNLYHWCTEPYIENETVGMNAPGMSYAAYELADRFGSVTGDYDSLNWAKFWATVYSGAYFAKDVVTLLNECAVVLPENGWARTIFDLAFSLHEEYPDDWRSAVLKLEAQRRHISGIDNIQTSSDVNNGFTLLALLYGGGDWTETCKVASLSGYDAECSAAIACGVIGIMNGMEGTPQKVKDVVYNDGKGVYVNDLTTGYFANIGTNYLEEQTWADIARMYQENAEKMIVAYGGRVEEDHYVIPVQKPYAVKTNLKANADFEFGSLDGWITKGEKIRIADWGDSHSGAYWGLVYEIGDRLYMHYENLTVGKTYRVTAFLRTSMVPTEARLFVEQGGTERWGTVYYMPNYWVSRSFSFVATDTTANIGLYKADGEGWAAIDDLCLEEDPSSVLGVWEGEEATLNGVSAMECHTASGGRATSYDEGSITFSGIQMEDEREVYARLYYSNVSIFPAPLSVYVNGEEYTNFHIPSTGTSGAFSCNYVEIPVRLLAGDNEIAFYVNGTVSVDRVEITTKHPYVF